MAYMIFAALLLAAVGQLVVAVLLFNLVRRLDVLAKRLSETRDSPAALHARIVDAHRRFG